MRHGSQHIPSKKPKTKTATHLVIGDVLVFRLHASLETLAILAILEKHKSLLSWILSFSDNSHTVVFAGSNPAPLIILRAIVSQNFRSPAQQLAS